jgi:hypothetical protein
MQACSVVVGEALRDVELVDLAAYKEHV